MAENRRSWKSWTLAAVGAFVVAYACNPFVIFFTSVTELDEGRWYQGMPLLLICVGLVFVGMLAWNLRHAPGLRGLERSIRIGAWLFMLAIPTMFIAGFLIGEGDAGAALIFAAILFSGLYVIQGGLLFLCAALVRRRIEADAGLTA